MDRTSLHFRIFLGIMAGILLLGTVGFMIVEGHSPLDAAYFTFVTITTVGYGDISPVSPAGKWLTIVLILGGVGTFTGLVANGTEWLLSRREKRARQRKQDMIMGLFFSELGTELLSLWTAADGERDRICREMGAEGPLTADSLERMKTLLGGHSYRVDPEKADLEAMRRLIQEKSGFLIRILENPSLLEEDSSAELLLAVFHLHQELDHRFTYEAEMSDQEKAHLGVDIHRAYRLLASAWLDHLAHLKVTYPFLFAMAVARNPFKKAGPVKPSEDPRE